MRLQPDTMQTLAPVWRSVPLREVIREAQIGFASGQRDPRGVLQLRMNNVTPRGQLDWSSVIRVPTDPETVAEYRLEEGDVLFNNTNSTELVGKTALFESHHEPVVFSNHFTRLRTIPDTLLPAFLTFWLQSQWQLRLFANICNRWVGQSAVHREKLLSLEIAVPPPGDQKRIAAILKEQMAAVERARAAAEAQLEAAKALPATYLRAILNRAEARDWPRRRLGDLLTAPLKTGISKQTVPDSSKRCLTLSAVRAGKLNLTATKPVDVTDKEAEGNWVKPGAFYVIRGNGNLPLVGRGAFAPRTIAEDVLYPDLLIEVNLDPEIIHSEYLNEIWNSEEVRRDIEARARTSAGIHKINQANLSDVSIPLPPLGEQQSIVAMLREQMAVANTAQRAAEEQLAAINALPAALLRRAFSGEL